MAALRDRLEQTILGEVEAAEVNGQGRPAGTEYHSICFDCIEGEALVIALDLKGWRFQPEPPARPGRSNRLMC